MDKYLSGSTWLTWLEKASPLQGRRLASIRGFSRFLFANCLFDRYFALAVNTPKQPKTVPETMNMAEIKAFLEGSMPGRTEALRARNRAIFELLYATGIRLSELVGLDVDDLDPAHHYVRVLGKGRKERIVPVGEYAMASLHNYCQNYRGQLLGGKESSALFLNAQGERITPRGVQYLIEKCCRLLELHKKLRPTPSATPLPPTCWIGAPISAPSRSFWAMPACPPPRCTPR